MLIKNSDLVDSFSRPRGVGKAHSNTHLIFSFSLETMHNFRHVLIRFRTSIILIECLEKHLVDADDSLSPNPIAAFRAAVW